jgi:ribosome-binding protein aMBF1 (putative translation factor)
MKRGTVTAEERANQPASVQEWIDRELARDPKFRREVEETLMGMRIEQDVAALRELRGVTQAQLAQMLGVKQPVIGRIEAGKAQNIGIRMLVRIATALGGQVHLSIKADPRPRRPIVLQGGQRGEIRGPAPERRVKVAGS